MTADILGDRSLEPFIRSWAVKPSSGGRFEVTLDGDLLYSKKALGRHAEPGEVKALVEARIAPLRPADFRVDEDDE